MRPVSLGFVAGIFTAAVVAIGFLQLPQHGASNASSSSASSSLSSLSSSSVARPSIVTSIKHPLFRRLRSIQTGVGKAQEGAFLIEGETQILAALDAGYPLAEIWMAADAVSSRIASKLGSSQNGSTVATIMLTQGLMKKLFPSGKCPDAVGVATTPILSLESVGLGNSKSLILEDIQDPGNLGTMLRCAEAFGVTHVLCVMTNHTQRLFSRVVIRASMGAIFRLKLSVTGTAKTAVSYCRRNGIRLVASTPHTNRTLSDCVPGSQCAYAIAVGNEARGLSETMLEGANETFCISMRGDVESLNVAVACGIMLYQATLGDVL
uniref:tRNA/rRNA methyltransferase SpoU type domain-containing protein n=1 Tax=Lotharella oceanica TaxID=641309 RepID=A0A7S2TK57_9EUKA|mmetsp:Transcript_15225/g.28968  ORF Transcript_15225/g.28968 Transcript_15225/m.28968 type:complete len:322 (+) Transcript_15225:70-1035(+)